MYWEELEVNKAKRFANQQRSNVDIALAGVYRFCLHAIKAVEENNSYIGQLLTAADRCKKFLNCNIFHVEFFFLVFTAVQRC